MRDQITFTQDQKNQFMRAMLKETQGNPRIPVTATNIASGHPGIVNRLGAELAQEGLLQHQGQGIFVMTEEGVEFAEAL